jgi:2-phosphosulfolactate phosphatase
MNVELILLPSAARPEHFRGRACAVFDVLRATTTMAAALAAGVMEIRLFDSLDAARTAANACAESRLLCGERDCLAPPGFDLGNSPGQFTGDHRGKTLFMCTTNGTRALLAAREAQLVIPAALVNAAAVARALCDAKLDLTLLCAGTAGEMALEDVLGAAAVMDELAKLGLPVEFSPAASRGLQIFRSIDGPITELLRNTRGGQNVIAAGLEEDIDFAARVNSLDVVGVARGNPLSVSILPAR